MEVLKQPQYQPMPAEKEVMILFAGANGYLDEWPTSAVADYEKQMLEFMDNKHPALLQEIRDKNDISADLAENLKKALDEFKGMFQPAV